jgi:hypothetical protein
VNANNDTWKAEGTIKRYATSMPFRFEPQKDAVKAPFYQSIRSLRRPI